MMRNNSQKRPFIARAGRAAVTASALAAGVLVNSAEGRKILAESGHSIIDSKTGSATASR
jgi:hypothetical protein